MLPTTTTQHETDALSLLTDAFKGRPNLEGFLKSFCAPMQDLEAVLRSTLVARRLDSATDAQLDDLGALVGERREGRSDTQYRASIRLRIHTNGSDGTTTDILRFASLAGAGSYHLNEGPKAAFEVVLVNANPTSPLDVARMLGEARAAGVRANLVYSPGDQSFYARFGWSGDGTLNDPALGWSGVLGQGLLASGAFGT